IRVQFYAQLRELIGVHELELELQQGANVRQLLEKIYAQKPALRAHDKSILIGAVLEFVDRNYKVNPGEEIAIMPPVQGGCPETARILVASLGRHVVAGTPFQRANAALF